MDSINPYLVIAGILVLLALGLVWSPLTTFSPAFSTPRQDVTLALDERYRQPVAAELVLAPYIEGHERRPRNPFIPQEVTRETLSGLNSSVSLPPTPPITLPEPPVILGPGLVEIK